MKKNSLIEKYLLLNPFMKGNIEIGIIILSGIVSIMLDLWKIPFFPVINITGGFLLLLSFLFHGYCENYHKQAHDNTREIKNIVTTGIYSKLRHPIYLSLIIMNISTAFIFNSWLSLFFGIIFSISWIFTALKEEIFLLKKFGEEYKEYMEKVHWRIIPGIF
jgi:protein-S-isoprenylcysteine O-methyltransferase Ste14